jgi:hypothetical protein
VDGDTQGAKVKLFKRKQKTITVNHTFNWQETITSATLEIKPASFVKMHEGKGDGRHSVSIEAVPPFKFTVKSTVTLEDGSKRTQVAVLKSSEKNEARNGAKHHD